jgi:LacI family transcriptional regulator
MTQKSPARRARPTLADVAKIAGVDVSLVSRVLRDDPKGFASKETRARILEASQSLGYKANAAAQGLRTSRAMTLGLLLPGFSSPVYSAIAQGVEEQATVRGHGIVLGTHAAGDPHETITDMLMHGRVDSMLVASGMIEDDSLRQLVERAPKSIVLLNRQVKGVAASVVMRDGDAAILAVEYLAELGHRSICGIFGPTTLDTMVRRKRGFLEACQKFNVESSFIDMSDRDYASGFEGGRRALSQRNRPTALLAGAFPLGVGVLAAALHLKCAVPEDVSVLSLHNDQLAHYLSPGLTTVSMPAKRLGAEAVELALDLFEGGTARRVVVPDPPQLILRKSTAAV